MRWHALLLLLFAGSLANQRCLPQEAKGRAVLWGHRRAVWVLAFSPDGKTLASGSQDATITLWDVTKALERKRSK